MIQKSSETKTFSEILRKKDNNTYKEIQNSKRVSETVSETERYTKKAENFRNNVDRRGVPYW